MSSTDPGTGRHRLRGGGRSPEWTLLRILGEVLRYERARQGWTEHDVVTRHSRLTPALLHAVEAGDPRLPLGVWVAVCEALGTSLGRALVRAEGVAGAHHDGQAWANAPTDAIVMDAGDLTRPPGQRPLGIRLGRLRQARQMSLEFAAQSLWWSTAHLHGIEEGNVGVSAAELLGVLALYGVTGDAATEWVQLIPLPCQHIHQSPVWMCDVCRVVLASVTGEDDHG